MSSEQALAAHAVASVVSGDSDQLASLFHYPSTYSPAEKRADAAAISRSVHFLLAHFGAPQPMEPHQSDASFYELGVFGGSREYWRALSPLNTTDFLYSGEFQSAGQAYLKVRVYWHEDAPSPEVHALAFGIPESSPRARERAIELLYGLANVQGISVPADFEAQLDRELQPSKFNGHSEQ